MSIYDLRLCYSTVSFEDVAYTAKDINPATNHVYIVNSRGCKWVPVCELSLIRF